ncbi:MAG TPA: IS1 family transposase [Albitalea sp.]|nr:IS1 family transposase [Albitalea sp.]
MNRLSTEDRARILSVLSEGSGINAACRITGASKNTVLKLLADVGEACALYQDREMRSLRCKRIEVDEIWSFVGAKEKSVRADHPEGYGDCYTFTAIDPDTKLMPCWLVGQRNRACTFEFIADLASRLATRVQLTTDGWNVYPDAVEAAFRGYVDYAVLNKSYAGGPAVVEARRRYSPPEFVTCSKAAVNGTPDMKHVSTSIVERSNLSLRMGNRRLTRLTNAFSKKMANHMHAMSFYFMVYNYVKIHSSVRCSPAMAAGITDTLWSMEDIVAMADTMES